MRRQDLVAALLPLFLWPLACGGSDKPAANASFSIGGDGGSPSQGQPGQACAPGQPCPYQGGPQPSTGPNQNGAPMGSVQTTDPNALATLLAAAAAAGSAILQPMGGGDPVELGIKAAAAQYAKGMTPAGNVAKGNLAEGGHVGFLVQMEPSKCYTVIGFGVGVTDLDLNLLAPPFYNLLAAQDGMAGPTAVIGQPQAMCPISPITVPYKVDIYAKKGGGMVGAQVYSRPK
jgi:hypothetical protein